jgi:plasmid stabilization system protein ParE
MVQIQWAGPAVADLLEVHDFIARDSRRYAELTIEKIQEAAKLLADFPQLGLVLPELPRSLYRQLIVGAYRVIYRFEKKRSRVLIMGVIHASRNLPPILKKRGFRK